MKITPRFQRFLVGALLAVAVILVYGRVTGDDFINIDDSDYVKENANINGGVSWTGLKWLLTASVAGNWHPVTMFSHMVDCQIYGLYAGGHHLTNVLFHLANTLLLFWLLLRITPVKEPGGANIFPSALVAALFALHPLHVESVAWVSERKDVLSGFFFMLTLLAYSNYVTTKGTTSPGVKKIRWLGAGAWYALTLALFALGLMSKPMLVTVPFLLMLLDYWPLGRFGPAKQSPITRRISFSFLFVEKLPFLALAGAFAAITFCVQREAGAVVALEHFPLMARFENAMVSYGRYLGKTFWPDSLAMPYAYESWPAWQVATGAIAFIGISAAAVLTIRRRPYFFVGWFWFAGMLVPVIGLVQVGLQSMADHFTYLPLIGIFIAFAWALADMASSPARRAILATAGAAVCVALAMTASVQVRQWKDSETLFEHAIRVTHKNSTAHYILGALLNSEGNTEKAQVHFVDAIHDNPGNVKARCALGYILFEQGKLDDAAEQYRFVLELEPSSPKAHFGLADVLLKQRKADEAMQQYFLALQSNPDIAEAHYQLAALFSGKRDPAAAVSHLSEAVRLAPDWTLAINNLAWMLSTQSEAKLRNGDEAMRLALHAVTLTRRSNPNTLDTLAAAYAETGKFPEAVETAESAIQKANAGGHTNLVAEIESHLKFYQSKQAYRE